MRPPPILWHYTDASGLLGIVRSGALRFGDARFLNDRTERRYGLELLQDIVTREAATRSVLSVAAMVNSHVGYLGRDSHLFVCSFSERNDSISQWQRYGANGAGYCVGFACAGVEALPPPNEGIRLHRMLYDRTEQEARIVGKFCELIRDVDKESNDDALVHDGFIDIIGLKIAFDLEELALELKHPSFADELEWRLIRRVSTAGQARVSDRIAFVCRGDYIKPTLDIPLYGRMGLLPIVQIISGPRLDAELAMASVEELLALNGYGAASVASSQLSHVWR